MFKFRIIPALALLMAFASTSLAQKDQLELKQGDHISIIGNTLADRMQHDGWLESYLQTRFPKLNLTIRNLGFSGDELTLRLRSADFGTPDEWLTKTKTDVVFAFFGYNESYAGEAGLQKFKADLEQFIQNTKGKKYGANPARLVLFSPIAHEDLKDRNLPNGEANNKRLALYTAAMAEIAKKNDVPFVDLYQPTLKQYSQTKIPLTINGVHLNSAGNEFVAQTIDSTLFASELARETGTLEKVRQSVLDKNFYWFQRYRTTDGYSIYGGRADLKFTSGQTNRVVAQREMEVLDVMTANRDKRVWAVAQGGDLKVDDSNTPAFIPVITNKPGPLEGGKHLFIDGEESIGKMKLAKGLKVNLFASEKQFPELVNPVQMTWDAKGRLWVAVWLTYPHWKPKEEMNDKILIFEDTNGDGKADKMIVYADKLHNPTGFEFTPDGVVVATAPDLFLLKDTNGDDKADERVRILSGVDSADTHHGSNSFSLDPGGAVYFQEGTFHHTQIESPYGPTLRNANAGVYRYEPRTQKVELYVNFGFANPHGHAWDRWGRDIVVDGTGSNPYDGALFSGRLDFPAKHGRPEQVYQQWTRPCSGIEYLSSRHFPESLQNNLLVLNVIGYQGILNYKITEQGSSLVGAEGERLLSSSDPNFRPSDIKVGPDGAIYFCDWHNPIIGHMQHNLRDPSRDREHGRIYRVTYEGRPLLTPAKIDGEPVEKLLELLRTPENRVRSLVKVELGRRKTDDVIAAVNKWVAALNPADAEYEHLVLEALWIHEWHNKLDMPLLQKVLTSKDYRARAAATRVLVNWRDSIPQALEILKEAANNESARVRLEAVRGASFFNQPEAVEIVLVASQKPMDKYLSYVRTETMKALDSVVKRAVASKTPIRFTTEAGTRYFAKLVGNDDLVKLERSGPVYSELLFRPGIRDEFRREAIQGLAKLSKEPELAVFMKAIREHDQAETTDESVAFDLVRLLTDRPTTELATVRGDLETMAQKGRSSLIRQLGYAGLIAADGKVDAAWALAGKSINSLKDIVFAMPLVRDLALRSELYTKVLPLLEQLPPELVKTLPKKNDVMGSYVRIQLPGRQRTLTLAEVEVVSDGQNVARNGKATQSSTSNGGNASRAIDGNKSGTWAEGGQTHSREGEDNPWWEVDLGKEVPIEAIAIYNRTDGNLGSRLSRYTLQVLDSKREVTYQKQNNPMPQVKADFALSAEAPDRIIRRATMTGLTTVRGQEAKSFAAISKFVKDDAERPFAIQSLLRLPASEWPKEEAKALLEVVVPKLRKLPTNERTTPAALDAMQFAEALSNMLPADEGKKLRKELNEIGVRVLRVGTLTDQMLFDKDRLVVQAGKPVEFLFENTDIMPHNFVILQPGSLEEIGNMAEAAATQAGAMERHYVPQSNKVLLSSRLLQPRNAQRLPFVAPTAPGVYPYVCTYPGHWRRMYGALYVVADLDEYLANPDEYLAKNNIQSKDELLKFNRPRKDWKFEELAPLVKDVKSGRSFNTGKQMFQVASCVSCHKLNGVGFEVGQDLTKLDPKIEAPVELLKHILEPSLKVDEKFQSWVFELSSGKKVTGLIVEAKNGTYKVLENPLAKAEPIVIKEADIDSKRKSDTSIMPKGLLDKLTKEEILDLIAFIAAKGDPKSPLFQGDHGGHGHQH
jgi:putative heme-binding domain-containing protein